MATVTIDRKSLMKKLLEARERAAQEDAKNLEKHEREELDSLVKFKSAIRRALKWDYKTAKRNYMRISTGMPSCPRRGTAQIDRAIADLKLDSRDTFRLLPSSDWYRAATWMPESSKQSLSLCD